MEGPGAKALLPVQRHFADLLGICQCSQVAGQDASLAVRVHLAWVPLKLREAEFYI